jgi:mono/diheme cytochrome c family protein
MPAFGETLSDNDIWAVLSFIHSRWPARVRERQSKINTPAR